MKGEKVAAVLSKTLVAENSKFNVYLNHVRDDCGLDVPNYLIVAPKVFSKNYVSGVAILPIIDGHIGLIKIYRPAIASLSWEIPHGFVEADEVNINSAIRELIEETGLEPTSIKSLGFITPDAGVLQARVELFVAEGCMKVADIEREFGLGELKLFSFCEFEKLIDTSVVQDSFTLAAWCKYLILKSNM